MKIFSAYKTKIKDSHGAFADTVELYRKATDFFIDVCLREWGGISQLAGTTRNNMVERLTVATKKNPFPRYPMPFYKFPSYRVRASRPAGQKTWLEEAAPASLEGTGRAAHRQRQGAPRRGPHQQGLCVEHILFCVRWVWSGRERQRQLFHVYVCQREALQLRPVGELQHRSEVLHPRNPKILACEGKVGHRGKSSSMFQENHLHLVYAH